MTIAVPLLALLLQVPGDSIVAADSALNLVRSVYVWLYEGTPPNWPLAPQRAPSGCTADSLETCMGGDWMCRLVIDCKHAVQAQRRAILIKDLERLAPRARGSAFMFRQRVAFAIKQGDYEGAMAVARECYGTEWWCQALRGFAAYMQNPTSGSAAFDSTLASAPPDIRCRWQDINPLIDSKVEISCSDPQVKRFWWLADPLWSVAGNARLSEHYARRVMMQIDDDVWSEGLSRHFQHCTYLAEGYPNSRRVLLVVADQPLDGTMCQPPNLQTCPRVNTAVRSDPTAVRCLEREYAYVNGGYSFVPDSMRLWNPIRSKASDWAVRWNEGKERYVTRERYHSMDHQTVVLRRGNQLEVAAAARLPREMIPDTQFAAALVLGRVEDQGLFVTPARIDGMHVFRARIQADTGAYVASLEVVAQNHVARTRHGAPAPSLTDGFGVSSPALVDTAYQPAVTSLDAALLATRDVGASRQVGIYFEVYGVQQGEVLEITVKGEGGGRSVFSRVLSALRLSSSNPVRLLWREPANLSEGGVMARVLNIDLGSLPSGSSQLTLTVGRANGTTTTASTEIIRS